MADFTYYNNKLCVSSKWLKSELMSEYSYDYYIKQKKFQVVKRGGGADNPSLIDYDTMPHRIKDKIYALVGDPYKKVVSNYLMRFITPDASARMYFAEQLIHDKNVDKKLPTLVANAEVLNACIELYKNRRQFRRKLGGETTNIWESISAEVNNLDKKLYPHSLPKSKDALRKKAKEYKDNGYPVLLHGNRGNKAALKRNEKLDNIIINIATMQTKPYDNVVHGLYEQFCKGNLTVVDKRTGEVFDHTDPDYVEISQGTVWNIINENRDLISALRDGSYHYSHHHRPHHHRKPAKYSLSKISLDDRDIMHTKTNKGERVMAYYVFDTQSTAIIGQAHSKKKDERLFIDAIASMYRFLNNYGLGIPMQAEVEHHLVNKFKDTLMTMFPFTRWANPTNSQEKWAETGVRLKKYGIEKMRHIAVGRHYAKNEKNKITQQKIFDEENNNYKERKATYEQIVAWDLEDIQLYNNELHPDQERFPGKTRLQVLLENVNPKLPKFPAHILALYAGKKITTSIRRNSYIKALNEKWMLSDVSMLDNLAYGNTNVVAYYMPDANGDVSELYLYQNGTFVGTAVAMPYYNTANAEWEATDKENYTKQASYVAQYDKRIKDKKQKTTRVEIIRNEPEQYADDPEIVSEVIPENDDWQATVTNDYAKRALEEL